MESHSFLSHTLVPCTAPIPPAPITEEQDEAHHCVVGRKGPVTDRAGVLARLGQNNAALAPDRGMQARKEAGEPEEGLGAALLPLTHFGPRFPGEGQMAGDRSPGGQRRH